jgi:TrmH family RNA methyltransferase
VQILTIGKHNPRLRDVRRALREGDLTSDGYLPVEGPNLVEEAIRCGIEVQDVFVREGQEPPPGINSAYQVGSSTFAHLAATRKSQGVIALVRLPQHRLEDLIGRAGLILVLCGLQDPGNVGAIVRLADAFRCTGCIAVAPTAGFYNPKVVRATAGSLFRVPHVRIPSLDTLGPLLTEKSVTIVGTAPDATVRLEAWAWTRPTAILLGNEGSGLAADARQLCDAMVRIPCPGPVDSLNTANAAAILLYAATRARTE